MALMHEVLQEVIEQRRFDTVYRRNFGSSIVNAAESQIEYEQVIWRNMTDL